MRSYTNVAHILWHLYVLIYLFIIFFLIRWLIRGIILHLQYSDGISHSMNQLLGVSSFRYVNNRFWSCDLYFCSGPVMTLNTKWCSVMNLFHWIHFWRGPWRLMSFLHFHFQFLFWKMTWHFGYTLNIGDINIWRHLLKSISI